MEDVRADGSFLALTADVGQISGRTARSVSTILREPGKLAEKKLATSRSPFQKRNREQRPMEFWHPRGWRPNSNSHPRLTGKNTPKFRGTFATRPRPVILVSLDEGGNEYLL